MTRNAGEDKNLLDTTRVKFCLNRNVL